jgi:hypothetical protein
MATSLATALQSLAKTQGQIQAPAEKKHGKASLLFDHQKAADVDLASIYQIGCEGEPWQSFCCVYFMPKGEF